jgi:hypothetical protein
MNEVIHARVVAREHANLDSLPLRFGIHFESDSDIVIEEVTEVAPLNRTHYCSVKGERDESKTRGVRA